MFEYFRDEMSTKIRAAREARRSDEFMINGPGKLTVDDYGSLRALISNAAAPVEAR